MKSFKVHYMNKYPGGKVECSEDRLDAYDADGELRVSLRKGGNGQLMDVGAEMGALDSHDLSPIPKNTRVWKLHKDGKIGLSEEARERHQIVKKAEVGGKILSIEEYKKAGAQVDKEGNLELPKAQAQEAAPASAPASQQ